MSLQFTFSIREISEVRDSEQVDGDILTTSSLVLQVLKIPMYFTVAWQENRLVVDPKHR